MPNRTVKSMENTRNSTSCNLLLNFEWWLPKRYTGFPRGYKKLSSAIRSHQIHGDSQQEISLQLNMIVQSMEHTQNAPSCNLFSSFKWQLINGVHRLFERMQMASFQTSSGSKFMKIVNRKFAHVEYICPKYERHSKYALLLLLVKL